MLTTAYWVALFLTVGILVAAAVWSLSFSIELGTCGTAPICGPLRETVVFV